MVRLCRLMWASLMHCACIWSFLKLKLFGLCACTSLKTKWRHAWCLTASRQFCQDAMLHFADLCFPTLGKDNQALHNLAVVNKQKATSRHEKVKFPSLNISGVYHSVYVGGCQVVMLHELLAFVANKENHYLPEQDNARLKMGLWRKKRKKGNHRMVETCFAPATPCLPTSAGHKSGETCYLVFLWQSAWTDFPQARVYGNTWPSEKLVAAIAMYLVLLKGGAQAEQKHGCTNTKILTAKFDRRSRYISY